jgi:hypothetical protein
MKGQGSLGNNVTRLRATGFALPAETGVVFLVNVFCPDLGNTKTQMGTVQWWLVGPSYSRIGAVIIILMRKPNSAFYFKKKSHSATVFKFSHIKFVFSLTVTEK